MKILIIANWKSNPDTSERAILLAKKIEARIPPSRKVEVVIAPPFPFLLPVREVLKHAKLGAQNAFWADVGPYTGEVSWRELKQCGIIYVIIGHSERKIWAGESDEMINKKVRALVENGMIPVLCVGERERVLGEISSAVGEQLKNALRGVRKSLIKNVVIAYEPIWAISTTPGAQSDTPQSVFKMSLYLRRILATLYGYTMAHKVRMIYGGSVTSHTAAGFLQEGAMQGLLVGGASLHPQEFGKILEEVV